MYLILLFQNDELALRVGRGQQAKGQSTSVMLSNKDLFHPAPPTSLNLFMAVRSPFCGRAWQRASRAVCSSVSDIMDRTTPESHAVILTPPIRVAASLAKLSSPTPSYMWSTDCCSCVTSTSSELSGWEICCKGARHQYICLYKELYMCMCVHTHTHAHTHLVDGSLLGLGVLGEPVLVEQVHPHPPVVLLQGLHGLLVDAALEDSQVILRALLGEACRREGRGWAQGCS